MRDNNSDSPAETPNEQVDGDLRAPLSRAESEFVRELFERHKLSLQRYLNGLVSTREDANEILQETFLRLLRRPDFEPLRINARAYLFQTATNLARDLFRRKTTQGVQVPVGLFHDSGLDPADWANWPELVLEGEQVGAVIMDALRELDHQVRAALLLNRFRELTHREIASRMKVSERTVERYVKEGLTHVGRRLKEKL